MAVASVRNFGLHAKELCIIVIIFIIHPRQPHVPIERWLFCCTILI